MQSWLFSNNDILHTGSSKFEKVVTYYKFFKKKA